MQVIPNCCKSAIKRWCRLPSSLSAVSLVISWAQLLSKSIMSLKNCIGINSHYKCKKCFRFSLLAHKNKPFFGSLEVFHAHARISKMFVLLMNNSIVSKWALNFAHATQKEITSHSFVNTFWTVVLGSQQWIFIFHGASTIWILKFEFPPDTMRNHFNCKNI